MLQSSREEINPFIKPLGLDGHILSAVLTEEDEAYTVLIDFVDRLDNPSPNARKTMKSRSKLSLAITPETRKASLNLIGRL